ncbi:peroxisome biogenesis protein 16 [Ananas comosus]|uniref:Peroxisomal membrane protein PEX16 n=1 Tax=Ananas comosus TaxID=4615 RepID=A0A6P5FG93_ANACO|nr:peroxisome biogenesis protein 16 [Ananas comosus]
MDAYKLWVRTNREFVRSLESLANGITWLLPERFSNSEIGPEAVYAVLGIVGTVNQHIIDTAPPPGRGFPVKPEKSGFPWSLFVSILKDAETVVEVGAQHLFGEKGKWNFLAVAEGVKALVRLAAFRDSGYRMLLQGGEVVNEEKILDVPEDYGGGMRANGWPGGYVRNGHQNGYSKNHNGIVPKNLEGRAMSALSRFGENAKMALDPMLLNRLRHPFEPPALVVEKPTLSSIWSEKGLSGRLFFVGEILSILRPLIYVMFIRKYGIRSWKPWLVSLAVDLSSMSILLHAASRPHRVGVKFYQLSTSEKDELKRRKLIWALYIMRDPFFTKYTKHHLEKADRYLSPVPLFGFLTAKVVELIVGAQTRYTYTSGS